MDPHIAEEVRAIADVSVKLIYVVLLFQATVAVRVRTLRINVFMLGLLLLQSPPAHNGKVERMMGQGQGQCGASCIRMYHFYFSWCAIGPFNLFGHFSLGRSCGGDNGVCCTCAPSAPDPEWF